MAAHKNPIITGRRPGGLSAIRRRLPSVERHDRDWRHARVQRTLVLSLYLLCAGAGGCSDSYRFEDNGASTAPTEVEAPTRNGNPQQKMQECDASCQAEGQSTGGG